MLASYEPYPYSSSGGAGLAESVSLRRTTDSGIRVPS